MKYLEFGASLYLPATREDLVEVGRGEKISKLRSVIFCTEDSVRHDEVPLALDNLKKALLEFSNEPMPLAAPLIFVRPRTPEILATILNMKGVAALRGFALPKFRLSNMQDWLNVLQDHPQFVCMPILETEEVFDAEAMRQLRDALMASPQREQVAVLRIGGLDLLHLMSIRRRCSRSIYDTALQYCLQQLASIFIPANFVLSAPAYECMEHHDILRDEIELDMLHGFYLKSVIHPDQIPILEDAYKVCSKDWEVAKALLDPTGPAVFRMDNRMCEKSTHGNWARCILRLADLYGVK